MKKLLIFIVTILLFVHIAYSGEIFINTDPIGVEVYLGKQLMGETPLRLSDFTEETSKKLRLVKKGYDEVVSEIEPNERRTQLIFYTLFSPNVDFTLSQRERNVFVNKVNAGKSPLVLKKIPNGIYEIESESDRISVSNAEYTRIKKSTTVEAIFSAGLFTASLGGMIHFNQQGDSSKADALGVSTAIFGGLLSYNLLKLLKIGTSEKRDRVEMSAIEISHENIEEDRELFTSGMEFVGKEYWDDALTKFQLLVNIYPESRYTPLGVYEIGYIHYATGKHDEAIKYLKEFVYEYPEIEFFSFAVYYLLDSELRLGKVDEALTEYEAIRPIYIDDASGTLYRNYYDVLVRLYEESGASSEQLMTDLLEELNYFINNYSDTYFYPDILFLKGKLLYKYIDREQGIAVLNHIKENYAHRQEIIEELEKVLHAR